MNNTTHQPKKKMNDPEPSHSISTGHGDEQNLSVLLKQYISVQTNISDLKSQIKDLNGTSKNIETKILQIMNNNNLQNIDTQNSIIQIKTTTVKKNINQKILTQYFGANLNIPPTAIKQFMDQLPYKTVQSLSIKIK
jgi:hypothetical protein